MQRAQMMGKHPMRAIQDVVVNGPDRWKLPAPKRDQHKYSRGAVAVFSGGLTSSGAGRLSAMAAARVGAGAVTVLSPAEALVANASHLTSIMLACVDTVAEMRALFRHRQPNAVVIGPGYGLDRSLSQMVVGLLVTLPSVRQVLDADALSAFRDNPSELFDAVARTGAHVVLTPHEGEFARLFPDLAADRTLSKAQKAFAAARLSGSVIVYKGPDTIIAAPDGRAVRNTNGSPYLATAGSGDVLAGLIAGLAAQGMEQFDAACAGVWLHAEAASRFGPGLIAEDLPGLLPPLLRELFA